MARRDPDCVYDSKSDQNFADEELLSPMSEVRPNDHPPRTFPSNYYGSFAPNHAHFRNEAVTNSVSSIPTLISPASTFDSMPLLTPPDSLRDLAHLELEEYTSSSDQLDQEAWMEEVWRARRSDVREGKKPQRPTSYDCLIADLPGAEHTRANGGEDAEEWLGLEYTVELSRREHEGSESPSISVIGENSKSRRSWAIIHQAWTHPMFQNDEYQRWKLWHRYLEVQEEQRKLDRWQTFYEFSLLYVKERRIREWILWHGERQVEIPGIDKVQKQLDIISAYRPDPYVPQAKHDIAWVLKRSRSVASLRELARSSLQI